MLNAVFYSVEFLIELVFCFCFCKSFFTIFLIRFFSLSSIYFASVPFCPQIATLVKILLPVVSHILCCLGKALFLTPAKSSHFFGKPFLIECACMLGNSLCQDITNIFLCMEIEVLRVLKTKPSAAFKSLIDDFLFEGTNYSPFSISLFSSYTKMNHKTF